MPRSSTFRLLFAAALLAAPPRAHADCIDDAAARHQVNALVLRAIGWRESHLQPRAIGRNANGTSDTGAFQINDIHLPALARFGIDATALLDGCVSAEVAAWHYRRQVDAFGNTWSAVGAYHSRTPALMRRYANEVASTLMQWHVLPAGPPPLEGSTSTTPRPPPRPGPRPPRETTARGTDDLATFSPLAFHPSDR